LLLHPCRIAVGAEQAAWPQCSEGAAITVLTDPVENDVKPARQDAREVFALVIDRRGTQCSDHRGVLPTRRPPQFQPGHAAEHKQRLTDGASGALHEHTLAALN